MFTNSQGARKTWFRRFGLALGRKVNHFKGATPSLERLDERITPVIGLHQLPAWVPVGTGYDGVGQTELLGHANLIYDGRHTITAAHVAQLLEYNPYHSSLWFSLPRDDYPYVKGVQVPFKVGSAVYAPDWDGNAAHGNDFAVYELAAIAPFEADRYELYRARDEVGKEFTFVGSGYDGVADGSDPPYVPPPFNSSRKRIGYNTFSTTADLLKGALFRIDITGTPTGGYFQLYNTNTGQFTGQIPFDAGASDIQLALEGVVGSGNVQVVDGPGMGRMYFVHFTGAEVGNVNEWGTASALDGPDDPRVHAHMYKDGGPDSKSYMSDSTLLSDFDDGTSEHDAFGALYGIIGHGLGDRECGTGGNDSGGGVFIDGKLAGVVSGVLDFQQKPPDANVPGDIDRTGIGNINIWARVSSFADMIDSLVHSPHDVVLDMNFQPTAFNDSADQIVARANGTALELVVNGVVRYTDTLGEVTSLTIRGATHGDPTSVTVQTMFTFPVHVEDVKSLIGPNTANTWNVSGDGSGTLDSTMSFSGVADLIGGSGRDAFAFKSGGHVSGNVVGGGNTDTLDYSAFNATVLTNLAKRTSTGIEGSFSDIEILKGSSRKDTLIGQDNSSMWEINAANGGNVNTVFAFSGVENVTGGSGTDTFTFKLGGSVAGSVDGGGGTDTLDYTTYNAAISTNLAAKTTNGVGGTFASIENLKGSSRSDVLVGENSANVWEINAKNFGSINGAFTFFAVENLTGGSDTDTFAFKPGGSVAENVVGGGGTDTLDNSAYNAAITTNLKTKTTNGVGGTFSSIESLIGSSRSDNLIGEDNPNVWKITTANAGNIDAAFSFTAVENLTGGTARDVFSFVGAGRVSGQLKGAAGSNWLDYSAITTGIQVNLAAGTAARTGGISNLENVLGSLAGNDKLIGSAGKNILVGHGKGNTINGLGGRDLVIGGFGRNFLYGGDDQDLVIAGKTLFDKDLDALDALMAEWGRNTSYANRVNNLLTGGGLTGGRRLTQNGTVRVDTTPAGPRFGRGGGLRQSTVFGNGGQDFFVVPSASIVVDFDRLHERFI